jgi:hypothetical protein
MIMSHDISLQIEKPKGIKKIKLSQDVHVVICDKKNDTIAIIRI